MKPHKQVNYLISIVNKRIWAITKLKRAGVSDEDLKFFYIMKIRSVLETSAAVFHSMLTNDDRSDLERVQRNVVRTIMGRRYLSYEDSLTILKLETLHERREEICLSFALKCQNSKKFSHMFEPVPHSDYNFRETLKFIEPHCHLERTRKSPLVYLTRLLNNYYSTKNSTNVTT